MGYRAQRCSIISIFMLLSWMSLLGNLEASAGKIFQLRNGEDGNCDLYDGSWVYDRSFPLYDSLACPFVHTRFNCLKYGRSDRFYLQYRWQPKSCNLPRYFLKTPAAWSPTVVHLCHANTFFAVCRFDAKDFLKKQKGKMIIFVGDSIRLNQFQSLICLLYVAFPHSNITHENAKDSSDTKFTFQDYGTTIMIFHSVYLVDVEKEKIGRVLKLDSLKNGQIWKKADVLVFNTWLWWYRSGSEQLWDYIRAGNRTFKDIDRMVAFCKGLSTWGKWVNSDVDTTRTRVFFQGISPSHYNGAEWNEPGVTNCSKETKPVMGSTYSEGLPRALAMVAELLSKMRKAVHLLNITRLSQLRKDAHPATHNGLGGMDCTHWCFAGLPDTWN